LLEERYGGSEKVGLLVPTDRVSDLGIGLLVTVVDA
jgi:hypothetical protein